MSSSRCSAALLLTVCLSQIGQSSSCAGEPYGPPGYSGHAQQRIGLPVLPDILQPTHWLHSDPNDPARSTGIGKPLKGTSWRNRPFHVGWMVGTLIGDSLVDGAVDQKTDIIGAYRLGWDFDHYWGTELRYAFAKPSLIDVQGGMPMRVATDQFVDLSLLYYPWGDAEWRPFAGVGLGVANFRFTDANQTAIDDLAVTIPISLGVKHYYRPWLALRTTVTDNFSIGTQGVDSMHNLSATVGVEVHFGGPRRTYFPYHGGGTIW